MIEIRVDGGFVEITGHAEFARLREGDPICAGVSALFWALPYGLGDVAGAEVDVETGPDRLRVSWREALSPEGTAVVRTIVGSLREIAEKYPGRVRIKEAAAHGA